MNHAIIIPAASRTITEGVIERVLRLAEPFIR